MNGYITTRTTTTLISTIKLTIKLLAYNSEYKYTSGSDDCMKYMIEEEENL